MKETGLMFKAPLVRAILEGRKTQTRRVAKAFNGVKGLDSILRRFPNQSGFEIGNPGDRIYVRETWRGVVNIAPPGFYEYAVARYVPDQEHCRRVEYAATQEYDGEPWRPAVHMPKWAARIWLEITGVRVERLQEITPDNCIAEGAWPVEQRELGRGHEVVSAFRELWESTGGDWAANPWVWVIDFKVLSTTGRPKQADG